MAKKKRKIMRVPVQVVLSVDAEGWAREFSIDAADVRGAVQNYFTITCDEQLHALGLRAATTEEIHV